VYVLFPTMLTSPVFSKSIWEQRTSSYPSVLRCLLQTRDMIWYLLVQLDLVRDSSRRSRQRFLKTITRLAELEATEHRFRQSTDQDASALVDVLTCFRGLVATIYDVVKKVYTLENTLEKVKQLFELIMHDEVLLAVKKGHTLEYTLEKVKQLFELIMLDERLLDERLVKAMLKKEKSGPADTPGSRGFIGSEPAESAAGGRGSPTRRRTFRSMVSDLHGKVSLSLSLSLSPSPSLNPSLTPSRPPSRTPSPSLTISRTRT
jgi:hypothetical protein